MPSVTRIDSPNFTPTVIAVGYVILHYTACDLPTTVKIFTEPDRASSHLAIDTKGEIYEFVQCLNGTPFRAWHAGKSEYTSGGEKIEDFNSRSVGIEIVNFNGNLFDYTDAQYSALAEVFKKLKELYPAIREPDRVLGHEDIAGFRGKSDPGVKFDWQRFFRECYPGQAAPQRHAIIEPQVLAELSQKAELAPEEIGARNEFFMTLSSELEQKMKKR